MIATDSALFFVVSGLGLLHKVITADIPDFDS